MIICAPVIADDQSAVETWVRLKGDAAGEVTYEWMLGTAHGVPDDGIATALFDIESVTLRQFMRVGQGAYIEQTYACRLYRSAGTDAYIGDFVNPLNAMSTPLRARCGAGQTVSYTPNNVELLSDLKITSSALGAPLRLKRTYVAHEVILQRASYSEFVAPSSDQRRRETSVDTFRVSRAALEGAASMLAPPYSWTSVTPWMTALQMDDRPGHMLWTVHGQNFGSAAELPDSFRQEIAKRFPTALAHRFDWSDHRAKQQ